MLSLAYPWLLLLLPLPWLVRRLLPAHRQARAALHVPFVDRLVNLTGQQPGQGAIVAPNPLLQMLTAVLVWTLLVLALARPVWLGEPQVKQLPTRDLLLAVDLSGSMETEDFGDQEDRRRSRMETVKQVLDGFLAQRDGDRVGLIFFGSGAYVQAPFTDDLEVVRLLLEEARPRMAGVKTALGDAIGLGMSLFERSELDDRVMLVLTDGNDTSSLVPPQRAAELARQSEVVLHAIGIGDPVAAGEDVLDEALLRQITETTGGRYFFAADGAALEQLTQTFDALVPREAETLSHQPRSDLYHWPLAAALLLSLPYPVSSAFARRGGGPRSGATAPSGPEPEA